MGRKEKLPKRNVPRGTKDKSNENKFSPLQAREDSSSRRDADGDVQMHQSEEDAVEPQKRREKHRQGYSLKQRATTTRIRNCGDKDYYGVLGLERTCDARDIITDKSARQEVGQAYQVLSNSQERAALINSMTVMRTKEASIHMTSSGRSSRTMLRGTSLARLTQLMKKMDQRPLTTPFWKFTLKLLPMSMNISQQRHVRRPRDAEKINDLNRRIKEENRKHSRPENDFLIKIDLLTGVRNEYNKATDMVQDGTASGKQSETLRRIVSQFENARKGYGYPETWKLPSAIGNGDSNDNQGPGKTNDARRILGYLPHVDSQRTIFFVESQPNGIAMKRSQDIGYDATRLYLELPESQKKDVRYSQSRYGKDQRGNYDQILGWDCRVPSNMSPSDWEYRRALPPSYGLVRFHNGSADILSRTALRNVLGREAADREINTFYEQRNMAPPWAQMPSRGRLPGRSYAKIQGPSVADSAINGQQGIEPTVRVKRSKRADIQVDPREMRINKPVLQ
ncbi:hypothetical protein AAWM_11183 [Aspergillus awamori]|uniref:J domain-containing protein n=1 Tax=Aspergillus awamori TaxID=105351 RepID=A0A401L9V6_ASPAW|nr:hypothetical protein AAWM_11183 [Aspergillus awamori]